ncbi:acetylornithine/succinyldiaminopimelate/putrescine aminotransferase [Bradyrhizobium sp. USDA 4452]
MLRGKGILAKDTHDHTIRIAPPLVITPDQVDWALEQIGAALTQDRS